MPRARRVAYRGERRNLLKSMGHFRELRADRRRRWAAKGFKWEPPRPWYREPRRERPTAGGGDRIAAAAARRNKRLAANRQHADSKI